VLDIAEGIQRMEALAQTLATTESRYYHAVLQQWHFTVTASLQLKALLQRWDVVTDYADLNFSEVELKHSKAVLIWLEQKINSQVFSL
jgi:hypothetical protein